MSSKETRTNRFKKKKSKKLNVPHAVLHNRLFANSTFFVRHSLCVLASMRVTNTQNHREIDKKKIYINERVMRKN